MMQLVPIRIYLLELKRRWPTGGCPMQLLPTRGCACSCWSFPLVVEVEGACNCKEKLTLSRCALTDGNCYSPLMQASAS